MAANPYSTRAYQTTAVDTSDRNHQVVLLFDAAVCFLYQARVGMEIGNYHAHCEGILRTQRILSALMMALDKEIGGELAEHLFGLYNWLHHTLTEASIADDLALLGEALAVIKSLRDAWRQAEQNLRSGQAEATEQPRAA